MAVVQQLAQSVLVNFDYPRISLLKAAWALSFWQYDKVRARLAQTLYDVTQDGDHVVAHSFGAAVVFACMHKLGRRFGHVWLIAPALNIDDQVTGFDGCQAHSITIVANPYDRALKAGSILPWMDISDVGRLGWRCGDDKRISTFFVPHRYLRGDQSDYLNHSYAFSGAICQDIASKIATQLRNHYG
ncbi:alpha/beta hydrolase [Bowmanella dokdonensis]|uniref:Alpha/beta hydrolase n=1 Tax=Bowmanella dokdonensis TaxID=751969 RepID=A0A939DLH8_9ALTE|nr:alpha/beta hydrolase [Bowmanella dokdonensis]MBN7824739.1 alpha/beta hydrolase [Bowmanella dokdonensis]